VLPGADAVADVLATAVVDVVDGARAAGRAARLGVATGRSPRQAYQRLAARVRSGWAVDPRTALVLLDEYLDLPREHPAVFRNVIEHELAAPLGLGPDRVLGPDPWSDDLDTECRRVEALVADGGIDLQILGIGRNGHIAFNEPGTPFDSRAHVVDLAPATRLDAARAFGSLESTPRRAITQGIATILTARRIVLVALGEHKAAAVRAAVVGPQTAATPASALRDHPTVVVLLDAAAASGLDTEVSGLGS